MEVAKRHQEQLERIKTNVRRSHDYFKPNYDRYNEYRRFVFESSLRPEEITLLMTQGKPQLEFNILEAYISRLLGEFSKQEPDIEVSADDNSMVDEEMAMTVKVVEQHLYHTLLDAKNHHTKYEVYKDLLSGGFSSLKMKTDYANPMSMHQVIDIERCYDPTLCGYDQLSRYAHKGDGRFCFELFPMAKDDFMADHSDIDISTLNFRRDFAGFNWSYLNDATPTLIVADYYEKKKRETRICLVRDEKRGSKTMKLSDYNKMIETWGDLAAPPAIIGEPRTTQLETIVRYRCIENQILEYVHTDFEMFPLIFVDGNSVMIKTPKNGNVRQVTRPYVYHAKGAQRLKNYAGIAWANEIENTVQHKFMIAKEALPKEAPLLEALEDVQKATVVVFNSVHESNPDMPISNPIREIQRVPMPVEISQAFTACDQLIQNILGSYDASLGINNNQLSGVALVEAATQSNAAAMPYIVGYLDGYQRAAQCYINLLPKYYTTPRTLPIMGKDGQKGYIKINQKDGLELSYDSNALNVTVKAGASFQVQKSRTIVMVKEMMGMSPLFAQFIAEKGLQFILDNMEGKGIDQLKVMVDGWLKEMQQQKKMAMEAQQQEMQNNPAILKAQNDQAKNEIEREKLQLDKEKMHSEHMVDMLELEIKKEEMKAKLEIAENAAAVQLVKAQTERYAKGVDLHIKHDDMKHRHIKEAIETHHMVNQPKEEKRSEA
jgi:hypothetical protein